MLVVKTRNLSTVWYGITVRLNFGKKYSTELRLIFFGKLRYSTKIRYYFFHTVLFKDKNFDFDFAEIIALNMLHALPIFVQVSPHRCFFDVNFVLSYDIANMF